MSPTQPVKVGVQPAKVVCEDGTFDCFCELFGVNCPEADPPPPVAAVDSARIWCSPRQVVRGATVTCKIYPGRHVPFHVVQRIADGLGGAAFSLAAGGDRNHPALDTAIWRGIAVVSTRVMVDVQIETSPNQLVPVPLAVDSFVVTNRNVPEYALVRTPTVFHAVKRGEMTSYPRHSTTAGNLKSTYGNFVGLATGIFDPFFNGLGSHAESVGEGPNAGLAFYRSIPSIRDSTEAWIHPALYGGLGNPEATAWYVDQDGGGLVHTFAPGDTVLRRACDAAGVNRLRAQAEIHEGVGGAGPSHYTNLRAELANAGIAARLERLFVQGDTSELLFKSAAPVYVLNDVLVLRDSTFDFSEYRRIFGNPAVRTDSGAIACWVFYSRIAPPPSP